MSQFWPFVLQYMCDSVSHFDCHRFHFHVNICKGGHCFSSECQQYVLRFRSLWVMFICCHFLQRGRMRAVVLLSTLCFQGRISCQLQQCIWHTHTHTNPSVTCHLPFNWQAETVPALVTHVSHPPGVCVCVWTHLWCNIRQADPAPPNKHTRRTR